ncbi:hypothetical protein [Lewinella sp. W8]|uniref:hypothetical protein n=1 Tax=Lewinella sp. W8 TaxID=2528208 RepID=UPI001068A4EE|nr:hypothetical protein [Lewinella sp. W8]MTB50456.1 hypothetical protein [Lewinella sp. W8]
MKTSPYLFLFSLLILFTSCTPLRVVRLEPEQEPDRMRYGAAILREANQQVSVEVSYYDATQDYLVFDLEVENVGDSPFDFDPSSCLLVGDAGPVARAINPEVQLLSMDVETVRKMKSNRAWAWVGTGLLVAGTVAAITSEVDAPITNDVATDAVVSSLAYNVADAITFSVVSAEIQNNQRNYVPDGQEIPGPDNRYFWLDYSLRTTTVRPGEVAVGKVVFPRNDEASSFTFQVSAAGKDFSFPFLQKVFKP